MQQPLKATDQQKSTTSGSKTQTRRVDMNMRGLSSTQDNRHSFIEAYNTFTKEEPDEATMSILEGLFLGSGSEVPAEYDEELLRSIHELVQRFKATPSMYADASNVPDVMFHTIDRDILSAMYLREFRVATVRAQGQQMADTDTSENAYVKYSATFESNIRSFLAPGGLSEKHPMVMDRCIAGIDMLKGAYESKSLHLPDIIDEAVHSIQNRPLLQQTAALRIAPPESRNLFCLSLTAFVRYIIPYDAAKMHEFYRPCGMRDVCCFIRADKSAGSLVPVRSPPLVCFWRPGSRSFIDTSLPPLCILCYCMYISLLSKMGRLRSQNAHFQQIFEVEVGGLTGFPKSYVYMPAMVQQQSRHNGFIGPFPNADVILENLICFKGEYNLRLQLPNFS